MLGVFFCRIDKYFVRNFLDFVSANLQSPFLYFCTFECVLRFFVLVNPTFLGKVKLIIIALLWIIEPSMLVYGLKSAKHFLKRLPPRLLRPLWSREKNAILPSMGFFWVFFSRKTFGLCFLEPIFLSKVQGAHSRWDMCNFDTRSTLDAP